MVYLIINGTKEELIGACAPFNFSYELFKNRKFPNQGYFCFSELFLTKKYKSIQTLKIINDDGLEFEFNDYLGTKCFYSQRGLLSISITVKDIFKLYKELFSYFTKVYSMPEQSYDCFATSHLCNLHCPYCFEGDVHHGFKQRLNYELAHQSIKKVMEINFGILPKTASRTTRLMGGETLLNLDTFKYTFEKQKQIMNELNERIDTVWIYTNYSTNNIPEFLTYADQEMLPVINKLVLIPTSDSLDINTSLRIKNQALMDQYKENFRLTGLWKHGKPKVVLSSNLMYLDYETTKATAKALYEYGLDFIQLAYDEFSQVHDAVRIKDELSDIFKQLEADNIPRLKNNLGKVAWVHFSVEVEDEIEIYRSKLAVRADYNVSKLNNY